MLKGTLNNENHRQNEMTLCKTHHPHRNHPHGYHGSSPIPVVLRLPAHCCTSILDASVDELVISPSQMCSTCSPIDRENGSTTEHTANNVLLCDTWMPYSCTHIPPPRTHTHRERQRETHRNTLTHQLHFDMAVLNPKEESIYGLCGDPLEGSGTFERSDSVIPMT